MEPALIAALSAVAVALIGMVLSPIIIYVLQSMTKAKDAKARAEEKANDKRLHDEEVAENRRRQDEVSAKTVEVAQKAAEAARLLVEYNRVLIEQGRQTREQLNEIDKQGKQIHTLVNSNLMVQVQRLQVSLDAQIIVTRQLFAANAKAGIEPTEMDKAALVELEKETEILRKEITERGAATTQAAADRALSP